MKKSTLLLLFMAVLFASCSDDTTNTDTDTNDETVLPSNLFPVANANYWNYEVVTTDITDNSQTTTTDNLYVASESGNLFTLAANDNTFANGAMSTILTSGTLTKTDNTLTINGELDFPFDLGIGAINLPNAILYDIQAANGSELFTSSNTITQDFDGIPMTITYTVRSEKVDRLATLDISGETFSNVEVVDLTLEMSISITTNAAGPPTTLSILDTQDVLNIRSYFADNVGFVKADSEVSYQLNATTISLLQLIGMGVPIPTSGSGISTEEIQDYFIEE